MMKLKPGEWELYYASRAKFHSSQGDPWHSPSYGVVAIAQNTGGQHYDMLASGDDFYVFRTDFGYWMECDLQGLIDQLSHHAQLITCVRVGLQIPLREFKGILKDVQDRIDQHQITVR